MPYRSKNSLLQKDTHMLYIPNTPLPLEGEEQEVLEDIANTFGVCPYLIIGDCKAMAVVRPRWIFWIYLYNHGYNTKECGGKTGGRDHASVLWGFNKMKNELSQNKDFLKLYALFAVKYKLSLYDEIKTHSHFRRDKMTGQYTSQLQQCA
jgi:hypothetical protein